MNEMGFARALVFHEHGEPRNEDVLGEPGAPEDGGPGVEMFAEFDGDLFRIRIERV